MVQDHHEGELVSMKNRGIGCVRTRRAKVVGIVGAGSDFPLHAVAVAIEVATAIQEAALANDGAVVADELNLGWKER
jgi:hypothetical protein